MTPEEKILQKLKDCEWTLDTTSVLNHMLDPDGEWTTVEVMLDDETYNDLLNCHQKLLDDIVDKWIADNGIVRNHEYDDRFERCGRCVFINLNDIEELNRFVSSTGLKIVPDEHFIKYRDDLNLIANKFWLGEETEEEPEQGDDHGSSFWQV